MGIFGSKEQQLEVVKSPELNMQYESRNEIGLVKETAHKTMTKALNLAEK